MEDEKIRKKIKTLQEDIAEAKVLPIHKDELRRMFEDRVEKINSFRINQLKANLSDVQNREERLIDELFMDNRLLLGPNRIRFSWRFLPRILKKSFPRYRKA